MGNYYLEDCLEVCMISMSDVFKCNTCSIVRHKSTTSPFSDLFYNF